MPDRAVASPVAVVLLLVVVVAVAGTLGASALGMADDLHAREPVAVSATATADGRVALVHRGGPGLDVRDLELRVGVDGESLARQPPVPFFSAEGFVSGPTGPFNAATDPEWSAGETASFRVARTNDPAFAPGATVTVRLFVRGRPVATAETTVPDPDADFDGGTSITPARAPGS